MVRKRKARVADEEKENEKERTATVGGASSGNESLLHGPMFTIMSNVQLNETFHKRYVKEMKQLYAKMDHHAFFFTFVKMIKSAMGADESNEFAHTTLIFCSKFVTSYDTEETHPLLSETVNWLMTTISNNPHVRYRLCQFVNMLLTALGQEAALDDVICDRILDYMLGRLRDISPNVRVQAILALQRLQVPDNPDDPVLRAYQFHLCADPSPRVRQAVITCMGRNHQTIPYILDRLWDIDEKVRRHTYLHMSSFPVRTYKVAQRVMFLEQGLNDRSELVRKVVVTVMLKQWIESYQNDLIALITALKLDSTEEEMNRFRKIAKQALMAVFKMRSKEDLLKCLPLAEDGEFHRCVPLDRVTIEISLYWQCVAQYLQAEMAEEMVVPELSTFCAYIEKFCTSQRSDMDQFDAMEFQYILLSLMEILYTFDLGDEMGRNTMQKLLGTLLKQHNLGEKIICLIVRCAENLIVDQNDRLQFFLEIVQDVCDLNAQQNHLVYNRTIVNELLALSNDANLNFKISSLKVKILDLEEQESDFIQRKDYVQAQKMTELKHKAIEEHEKLLQPLLEKSTLSQSLQLANGMNKEKRREENILKGLQITFYMVVSPRVTSLNPNVFRLYKDFICLHMASHQINTRDWALKCATAYSMLYEALSKDVFVELYSQFIKNHNIQIWETSITCIFELVDRYGVECFADQQNEELSKSRRKKITGRQLYNTLEFVDAEDETLSSVDQSVSVIFMMSHFLDTCDNIRIVSALVKGFCQLVLHGSLTNSDIMEKLLIRYFNPTTVPEINQVLGVFLEKLIQKKQYTLLQNSMLPTVNNVMSASYDSPLHDIRPETITRFVISATRQEVAATNSNNHVHNKIAMSFLNEMLSNVSNKELCRLLAAELITLDLNLTFSGYSLKGEMKEMSDKLIKFDFDPKTLKNLVTFKGILDGVYNRPVRPSGVESDEEGRSDDDKETRNSEATDKPMDDDNTTSNEPSEAPIAESEELMLTETPSTDTVQVPIASVAAVAPNNTIEMPEEYLNVPPPVNAITASPMAKTPTTFGPNNIVGHRFLRKSLNSSQSESLERESSSENPPGRNGKRTPIGSKRKNKIRIEARIDSDKKTPRSPRRTPPPASKDADKNIASRARRNLGYDKIISQNTDTNRTTTAVRGRKRAKSASVGTTSETSSVSELAVTTTTATRRSCQRRHTKSMNGPSDQSKSVRTDNSLAIPSPDVIPPSPEIASSEPVVQRSRILLRRVRTVPTPSSPVLANSRRKTPTVSRTSTRKSSSPINASESPKRAASEVVNRRNLRTRTKSINTGSSPTTTKPTSQDDVATPVRNGRKRILQQSPKESTTTRTTTTAPKGTPSKDSTSPKNAVLPKHKQSRRDVVSPKATITRNHSLILQSVNSVIEKSPPAANLSKDNSGKRLQQTPTSPKVIRNATAKPVSLKRPRPITPPEPQGIEQRPVTTRNVARLVYKSKMIMTRKRASMESLSSSVSSNSVTNANTKSAATSQQSIQKLIPSNQIRNQPISQSRIPVRSQTVTNVQTKSINSSSSEDNARARIRGRSPVVKLRRNDLRPPLNPPPRMGVKQPNVNAISTKIVKKDQQTSRSQQPIKAMRFRRN